MAGYLFRAPTFGRYPYPRDLRFQGGPYQEMLGLDPNIYPGATGYERIFRGSTPPRYPYARSPVYLADDAVWGTNPNLLAPVAPQNPFAQTDWPYPFKSQWRYGAPQLPETMASQAIDILLIKPFNQADWPRYFPVRPAILNESQEPTEGSLLETTLVGQGTYYGAPGEVPTYNYPAYPYPKPRLFAGSQDPVLGSLLTSTLLGQGIIYGAPGEAPAYNYPPYPYPRSPSFVAAASEPSATGSLLGTTLVGQGSFFGGPGQIQDYDYPRYPYPVPRLFAESQDPVLGSLLTTTLVGQGSFFGQPGEVPTYDWPRYPYQRTSALPFDYPVNAALLASVAVSNPFYQTDFPRYPYATPRLYAESELAAIGSLLCSTLVGQGSFFGGPGQVPTYNYPAYPYGRSPAYVAGTTQADWQNPLTTVLVGQGSYFGAPGEAPTYDYPRYPYPVPRLYAVTLGVASLNPLLIAPFVQSDWPRYFPPRPALFSESQDPVLGSLLATTLIGQGSIYGAPGEAPTYNYPPYPYPRSGAYAGLSEPSVYQNNALLNVLVGQGSFFGGPGQVPTFNYPRYPYPVPRLFASTADTFATFIPRIVVETHDPFYQTDWPRYFPVRPALFQESQQSVLGSLLITTLFGQDKIYGAPGEVPVYIYPPYPYPRSPAYAGLSEPSVWQNNALETVLVGQGSFYGGPGQVPTFNYPQYPYPVSRIYAARMDTPPVFPAREAGVVNPFAQTDWPYPLARVWRLGALYLVETAAIRGTSGLLLARPFNQEDWPRYYDIRQHYVENVVRERRLPIVFTESISLAIDLGVSADALQQIFESLTFSVGISLHEAETLVASNALTFAQLLAISPQAKGVFDEQLNLLLSMDVVARMSANIPRSVAFAVEAAVNAAILSNVPLQIHIKLLGKQQRAVDEKGDQQRGKGIKGTLLRDIKIKGDF